MIVRTEGPVQLDEHPLLWEAYQTCLRIEECGASDALTAAVVQAGKVLAAAKLLVREHARLTVALETARADTERERRMWACDNVARSGPSWCPLHDGNDPSCDKCQHELSRRIGHIEAGAYYTSDEVFGRVGGGTDATGGVSSTTQSRELTHEDESRNATPEPARPE